MAARKPITLLAVLRRLCQVDTQAAFGHVDWKHLYNKITDLQNIRYEKLTKQQHELHAQQRNADTLAASSAITQQIREISRKLDTLQEDICDHIVKLTANFLHPLVYMDAYSVRDNNVLLWYRSDCKSIYNSDIGEPTYYPEWYLVRYCSAQPVPVEGEDYFAWPGDMTMVYVEPVPEGHLAVAPYVKRVLEGSRYWSKHVARCGRCNAAWVKTMLHLNPFFRKMLCPKCNVSAENFQNKPHEMQYIISGYHSTERGRGWVFIPQTLKGEMSPLMGLEIEMDYKKSAKLTSREAVCWTLYQEQLEQNEKWHNFYFENDGSLNDATGVEMITQPMTLEYHQNYWDVILPLVRKYFKGWESKHDNYGIHITMDRHDWTDLQLARFSKFVENPDNRNFTQAIAQRNQFYRADHELASKKTMVKDIFKVENGKVLGSVQRNSIVNVKNNGCVEFRMFKSTLNTESFFKNLEFLDAFNRWSKETAFSTNYQDFLRWLVSSRGLFNRYTNLLNYLARPTFYVKGRQGYKSDWADMITYHNKQLMLFEVDDFIPEAA